jgi:hypothetical protein
MKIAGKKDDAIVSSKVHTERELDEAVKDVEKLKATGAVALYQLGKRIVDIQNNNLWKLRTEKDAKTGKVGVRWKSFDAFCHEELGISPSSASSLSAIARNYSENDVKLFGTKKLALVLQAPREERPRLQAQVAKGASKKAIETEVRRVNRERASDPEVKGRAKGRAAAASKHREKAKAKAKSTSVITVAKILGVETVKLIKRPSKIGGDNSDAPRARKLSDEPYGCIQLASDVTMHFHITSDAAGALVLKVRTVRDE